ncbi:MAG: creatininase family protein [Deltaproteobacteria bacterium]|nr:creatininase family protein [Deltaproteobacteria bacterium]
MEGYSIFRGTIADMTWPQVEEALQKNALMIIPIAVIEQHGPHLPLATDTYAAYLMCRLIKEELVRSGIETLMSPPYYFGMNPSTGMFPGSLSITRETMMSVLTEIFLDYGKFGFNRQFILNHHGDPSHNDAIIQAILSVRKKGIDAVYTMGGFPQHFIEEAYTSAFNKPLPLPGDAVIKAEESAETRQARERLTKSELHVHAEERETGMIMKYYPDVLDRNIEINRLKPVLPTPEEFSDALKEDKWRELSPLGYIGDPSVATEENGELYALESADIAKAIIKFLDQKK